MNANVSNHTHNTISPKITIHYPFHALCGYSLEVVYSSKKGDRVITCIDPKGRTIKIPLWMTSLSSGGYKISDSLKICPRALVGLARLLCGAAKG